MRHYLSALCLLFVSICAFSTPAETPPEPALRIATPWPAQNAIIMMLGYGGNITGTSRVAKQIPLFRQMLPQIDDVPVIGTTGGNELNIEQILSLRTDILFIHDGIRVPQQEVLAQAGVRVQYGCTAGAGKTDRRGTWPGCGREGGAIRALFP